MGTRPADGGPLVTVVIVNWDGAHLLPPCLEALAAQDLPAGQMAVWVVDNASHDGSRELLARRRALARRARVGRCQLERWLVPR